MEPHAYEMGLLPWDFGRLLPGEFLDAFEGYQRRVVTAAWWRERFARERRLKGLEKYLKRPETAKEPPGHARQEYEDLKVRLATPGVAPSEPRTPRP